LGQRFRLKSSFSVSGFSPQVKVILIALQKYGMMVADNGSSWFISGTQDEHWNNTTLKELRKVTGSDFEAVDASGLSLSPNSARVRVQK
jgi:hypothetical protein